MSSRYIPLHGKVSLQANFIACSVADVPLMLINWTSYTPHSWCLCTNRTRLNVWNMQKLIVLELFYLVSTWKLWVAVVLIDDDWIWDVFHHDILEDYLAGESMTSLIHAVAVKDKNACIFSFVRFNVEQVALDHLPCFDPRTIFSVGDIDAINSYVLHSSCWVWFAQASDTDVNSLDELESVRHYKKVDNGE